MVTVIRGTTPTHIFTLPFDAACIAEIRLVYSQFGGPDLVKTVSDCMLSGNEVRVKLTQRETLSFDACKIIEVQMRVLTTDGSVLGSKTIRAICEGCVDSEVLE